jgi:hypothetical protein
MIDTAAGALEIDGNLVDAARQSVPWPEELVDVEGDPCSPTRFRIRINLPRDDHDVYLLCVNRSAELPQVVPYPRTAR